MRRRSKAICAGGGGWGSTTPSSLTILPMPLVPSDRRAGRVGEDDAEGLVAFDLGVALDRDGDGLGRFAGREAERAALEP